MSVLKYTLQNKVANGNPGCYAHAQSLNRQIHQSMNGAWA